MQHFEKKKAVNIAQELEEEKKKTHRKDPQANKKPPLTGGSPSSLQISINYLSVGNDTKIILEFEISCC